MADYKYFISKGAVIAKQGFKSECDNHKSCKTIRQFCQSSEQYTENPNVTDIFLRITVFIQLIVSCYLEQIFSTCFYLPSLLHQVTLLIYQKNTHKQYLDNIFSQQSDKKQTPACNHNLIL